MFTLHFILKLLSDLQIKFIQYYVSPFNCIVCKVINQIGRNKIEEKRAIFVNVERRIWRQASV